MSDAISTRLPDRIAARIEPDLDTGCWLWTGKRDNKMGYGRYKDRVAHRVVYTLLLGEPPAYLDLDHLCRRPACVNPAHLEPVTRRENLLRGQTITASNAAKTSCFHGHEFTPGNTRIRPNGSRACRACSNRRRARYRNRGYG